MDATLFSAEFIPPEKNVADDDLKLEFDKARRMYPKPKCGLDIEWHKFLSKCKAKKWDVEKSVKMMVPAIQKMISYHEYLKRNNKFCPNYKSWDRWMGNGFWTEEYPDHFEATQASPAIRQLVKPVCNKIVPPEWELQAEFNRKKPEEKQDILNRALQELIDCKVNINRNVKPSMNIYQIKKQVFKIMERDKKAPT